MPHPTDSENANVERLNVALTPSAIKAIARLQQRTGRKKGDLVNNALLVLDFIQDEIDKGNEILTQNPTDPNAEAKRFKLFF